MVAIYPQGQNIKENHLCQSTSFAHIPHTLNSISQQWRDDIYHDIFVNLERLVNKKAEKEKKKTKAKEYIMILLNTNLYF